MNETHPMTEGDIRQIAKRYPEVQIRQLVHVIEGAAAEAAAGLTATRVVCGWRLVVDREPPGDWLLTATPMNGKPVLAPPEAVTVVAGCIASEAGAPLAALEATTFDADRCELRIAWRVLPSTEKTS